MRPGLEGGRVGDLYHQLLGHKEGGIMKCQWPKHFRVQGLPDLKHS